MGLGKEDAMTDPFIGEIRINAFDYAPQGWASCNGQSLPIQQNAALYSLIGAYFGKTQTDFNLPDLRGRAPVGYYTNSQTIGMLSHYNLGDKGGTETVALTMAQIPAHTHTWQAVNTAGNQLPPAGNLYAQSPSNIYSAVGTPPANLVPLNPKIMDEVGAGAAHPNMQPYLALNFCIALTGYYPPRA